jgi:hypothetical protein
LAGKIDRYGDHLGNVLENAEIEALRVGKKARVRRSDET